MATTPLQGWTVPGGSDAPANASAFAALGGFAEAQSNMVFATTSARDTAIPTGSRKAGMVSLATADGVWRTVLTNGGSWIPLSQVQALPSLQGAGGAFIGTYDSTKPLKFWLFNAVQTCDTNGDTVLLTGATVGSGCVLAAAISGAATSEAVTTIRQVSGNLVARVWVGTSLLISTSLALQGIVIGQ